MGFVWVEEKDDDKRFTDHIKTITGPLETSKTELQKDIKKLKKQLKEVEGIDPAEYTRIKTELQKFKDKSDEDETDAEKRIRVMKEQHEQQIADLEGSVNKIKKKEKKRKKENNKNIIEKEIAKGIAKAGIKSSLISIAEKIFRNDAVVIKENGKRKAVIGDKSIKEHIKSWAETDEGKNFVKAPNNSGGGSSGGGKTKTTTIEESVFDPKSKNFNRTKQIYLKKSNPEKYDKYVKKYAK